MLRSGQYVTQRLLRCDEQLCRRPLRYRGSWHDTGVAAYVTRELNPETFDKANSDTERLTSLCVLLGPSVEVVALDQP